MTASFAPQEIWHVMIASDDMKRMNVDQLDDAFRLDIVDASTLVWKNGMEKWRRLGSIAGIDDEPETIARPLGPPAPPPPPRPRVQRSVAPQVNPFAATVNPFAATAQYTSNTPAAVFAAPQLAAPQLFAPDPYVLPKRRVKVPSEVDFRRGTGVRWGRWLVAFVLLTGGVLGAYRQNYLHEGARKIGLENKYLYGEKRVVGWVTAKTPSAVQAALRQLKLLPSVNAIGAAPLAAAAPAVAAATPPPAPETVKASAPTTAGDSDVKTVSLDSLPVLGAEAAQAAPVAAAPAPAPKARAVARSEPKVATRPAKKVAREEEAADEPAPKPAKAKAEPKPEPKAEPKVEVKPPPPSANEGFLKSAIREAIANDSKKK